MDINYNNKVFKAIKNSSNGEVSSELIFLYKQNKNILSCSYADGSIVYGHLLGIVKNNGDIELSYHQVNSSNELRTGTCYSTPEVLENGKIRLHEKWQWTNGDLSEGTSILEEL